MPSKIWIDLDNTPHVPFFIPIIQALESRGHALTITTRRMSQLIELADKAKFDFHTIGQHAGKSKLKKVIGLAKRACECYSFLNKPYPDLALSHGARSQLITANILKIPTIEFIDYEHVATPPLCKPKWEGRQKTDL